MTMRIPLVLAGLCGALGVALSAMGAHIPGGASLGTAGLFLLLHGAAFLALAALAGRDGMARPFVAAILIGWTLGLGLFCCDLAARVFLGFRLFPGAAPTGGVLLILTWLGLALAGLRTHR
ncbi:MAG: DUF423 domain-containing protein [Rhabdaerophilum sp.]